MDYVTIAYEGHGYNRQPQGFLQRHYIVAGLTIQIAENTTAMIMSKK